MLEKLGLKNIKIARNPNEAYKIIKDFSFDMILMDVNYDTGHDGYDFLNKIRKENLIKKNSSVIFITAENSKKYFASIQDLKPDDYILKPFTFNDIKNRIERSFGKKDLLDKVYYYLDKNEYDLALNEIENLLIFNQADKRNLQNLYGQILLDMKDYNTAYNYFNTLGVEHDWVLLGKLKAIYGLKNYKESKYIIEKIKKSNTHVISQASEINSKILFENEMYDKAYSDLSYSLYLTPKNHEKRAKLIKLGNFLRKKEEVLELYKQMMILSKNVFENEIFFQFDMLRLIISMLETGLEVSRRNVLIIENIIKKLEKNKVDFYEGYFLDLFKERFNRIKSRNKDTSKIIKIVNEDLMNEIEINTLLDLMELFKLEKEELFFDICYEKVKYKLESNLFNEVELRLINKQINKIINPEENSETDEDLL